MPTLTVRPVRRDTWPDFQRLFTAPGGPHYCFCTPYRVAGGDHLDTEQRQEAMCSLVEAGTPVGVLGAQVVEAYPWDTAGTSATHRGHSCVFAAGFTQSGRRWAREVGLTGSTAQSLRA